MTNELVLAPLPPESREGEPVALTPAQSLLLKRVLDSVVSPHSKRNYARALDDLFAFCASRPLSRSLLMEWRAGMETLSPSTINVRLSAVRKLVGEARSAGMIGPEEEAASLTDIPNISQKGTRLRNWLTREQAKELLAVPDRSTLKGKRDYVILALLVGCAQAERAGGAQRRDHPTKGRAVGPGRPRRQGPAYPHGRDPDLGQAGNQRLDDRR
jgi:integrase